jgi:dCMP deaminase
MIKGQMDTAGMVWRYPEIRLVDPPFRLEPMPPLEDYIMNKEKSYIKGGQFQGVSEAHIHKAFKWDYRFLALAKHIAEWSKDPSTKVGAVIVDANRVVVGQGYNGFARGVQDTTERYNDRSFKYPLVVHAELNAILNAGHRAKGGTIYVYPTMMMPAACPECAKAIVQSGIKCVVYYQNDHINESKWKESEKFTRIILYEGGVDTLALPEPPSPDFAPIDLKVGETITYLKDDVGVLVSKDGKSQF